MASESVWYKQTKGMFALRCILKPVVLQETCLAMTGHCINLFDKCLYIRGIHLVCAAISNSRFQEALHDSTCTSQINNGLEVNASIICY